MARQKTLEWTKLGPGTGEGFEIDAAEILTHPRTGSQVAQISSITSIELERLVDGVWTDVSAQVSIGSGSIQDGALTNSAITFAIAADLDATPPGGEDEKYQIVARVVLDNGQGEALFAPLRIWESATIEA